MKELIDIRDYLFTSMDVGDWEGEEEIVADRLNEMLYLAWNHLPEDISTEKADTILAGIWEQFRGETAILEASLDDLLMWTEQYVEQCKQNEN
ncbi:hypothetical protein [Flocculibacter collagenilyticus]|uniref:hypothetical protein n=1 Tax=Flocculibacter collagenilyticus TaxID=2744479 RepID=UPI0018F411EF|nr:hypothetical protein [Flocculibacter collagenilyticus]